MNRKVSYELHVKPLFSEGQRECMLDTFDLANYLDFKQWGVQNAHRITDKTMPADASNPWPDEWIALCNRWVAEGCAP